MVVTTWWVIDIPIYDTTASLKPPSNIPWFGIHNLNASLLCSLVNCECGSFWGA